MNFLFTLLIGIIYVFVLMVLAFIVIAPASGIGIWTKSNGGIDYAWKIPAYVRFLCFVLLIFLLSGGLYFLWKNITPLS